MEYHFRNLVFEGGGVKGIAYAGVLQVLETRGILKGINRVGGTSAGAINALLLGLGCSLPEIEDILKRLDFKSFLDNSWGYVRDIKRLLTEFGWYKGDAFRSWIASVIEEKTGNSESTFKDIASLKGSRGFRDLYFVGTNLSTGFGEVFSNEHTPTMCVADAIRISMSIPLFFAAKRTTRGDVYVDGGLLDNYPIKLFDRMKYVDRLLPCARLLRQPQRAAQRRGQGDKPLCLQSGNTRLPARFRPGDSGVSGQCGAGPPGDSECPRLYQGPGRIHHGRAGEPAPPHRRLAADDLRRYDRRGHHSISI